MRNKSLLFAFVLVPLLGCIAVTFLSATATFTYRHPQGDLLRVTRDGRVVKPLETDELSRDATNPTVPQPRAVANELSHDFGIMNPLTMGRHIFVVRNEGQSPLALVQGPTTCKCTISSVAQDEIPPGGQGEITLDWNTGRDRFYSHEATIFTNDAQSELLHFHVHGNVRTQLGTIPETLTFTALRPDEATTGEVIVYSQVWDDFELAEGRASNTDITWTVEQIDTTDLKDATAARRIKITVPAGLPEGRLSERLQFLVRPTNDEDTMLDLAFEGKVPRRLAVMGEGVRADGVVDLGQVRHGEQLKRRILLKVRDEEQELIASHIRCDPGFVVATVLPYEGVSKDVGLSMLEIALPRDAPACSYLGVPMGNIEIDFDHPRIESLNLKLKFAIVAETRKGS